MSGVLNTFRNFQQQDYPYFRRIRNNIVAALLAVSLIPLIIIGGGMYYYASSVLKQNTLTSLRTEVLSHKKAIDQFLAERTMDLKLVSNNLSLSHLIQPGVIESVYNSLNRELSSFIDLGVIDSQGGHLTYAGPYQLASKNYKNVLWFEQTMKHDVYISDVFPGFRNEPHFIIAVKKVTGNGAWILRATVNAAYFNDLVSGLSGQKKQDSYLVNKNGNFQTGSRMAGKLMEQSDIKQLEHFKGIRMEEKDGIVRMTLWLEKVPWLYVVEINHQDIFSKLYHIYMLGGLVFLLGAFMIVWTVILTTNRLVSMLEYDKSSIHVLNQQLRRASYLASSMELSYGFFREIKDTLSNIDVAAAWIRELTRENRLDDIKKNIEQVKSEALRGQKAIDKFFNFIKPGDPIITEVNINEILNDLLEILKEEFSFKNINVKLDFQHDFPSVRSDASKLRHLFQNLVLNAMSAIEQDGEIIFVTRSVEDGVTVIITDNGKGISEENLKNIFDPLFTTKPQGTGLGLSICLNILKRLGGSISVKSELGKGASFIVKLPFFFG